MPWTIFDREYRVQISLSTSQVVKFIGNILAVDDFSK